MDSTDPSPASSRGLDAPGPRTPWTPAATTPGGSLRPLFVVSFAVLFVEMAAIRWLNASVPVLGYFNNFILISSFFGLGLGCLIAQRRGSLIPWTAPVFLLFVLAVLLLHQFGVEVTLDGDYIFAENREFHDSGVLRVSFSALAGFFLNTIFFAILGQELGRRLAAARDPLAAYGADIAGSLVGVLAFALCSRLGLPPPVWFAIGIGSLLVFVPRRPLWLAGSGISLAVALFLVGRAAPGAEWSPYYKVEAHPYADATGAVIGYQIRVDNLRIQDALHFGPRLVESPLGVWIPYYQLPYHFTAPRRVLVLGAGSGNEAVVARMAGAETVHAVEIDPVIASFGERLHPHRPYLEPGIEVFVDDARAYVESCDEQYDLVVMSALDSHKQVAGLSSLRLESYIYTVEAFRRVRELLAPDGVFCLNVSSYRPWIRDRVYWSLTEAFGEPPRVLGSDGIAAHSVAYVMGPAEIFSRDLLPGGTPVHELPAPPARAGTLLATDDWPHLYLESRQLPSLYIGVLITLLVLSSGLVVVAAPSARRPQLEFFFLGAGFMLLETRAVTQMALLFGSTWSVNAVVVGAILITILLANRWVMTGRAPSRPWATGLLLATLLAGYFFPIGCLAGLATVWKVIGGGLVIGLPILWASVLFSRALAGRRDVSAVFGSNLLGVVCGGCLEYLSTCFGLQALYLLAAALYAAAAVTGGGGRVRRVATPAAVISARV